jgi:glycosyltransferase involved in cell wall biosynthesis
MEPASNDRARLRTCIVVPCYNEEKRLDTAAFERYLATSADVCFVLVNDGSKDSTLALLESLARKYPERVSAVDLTPNRGKAEAVRQGLRLAMASQQYAYAGFWDADLATPLDAIPMFVDVFERLPDVDMVFGTRVQLLGRRIARRAVRHYFGRVFATAASLVLSLPIYDTQCGAKLFRVHDRNAALFSTPFGSRWIFDVEIVARHMQSTRGLVARGASVGVGIYELPLERWEDIGESKVRGVDFARAIGEMAAIYRRYRLADDRRSLLGLVTAPLARYAGVGAIGTMAHYAVLLAAVELGHVGPTAGSALGATVGPSSTTC